MAMSEHNHQLLRKLPSVDELARLAASPSVPRTVVVEAVRDSIAHFRRRLGDGTTTASGEGQLRDAILADVRQRILSTMATHYRKVINATGIILHTALGRAVLPPQALEQVVKEHAGYSLLQMDLKAGERSKRDERIEALLKLLTGAEAATVVNNNAAATSIVLNTLARGREVIVSRGQLVEIGGSFRLPDVMAASGVRLVEVGTTNKTHARDYENAINDNTAAIMRIHPSNYRIEGFTAEVGLDELIAIAHRHKLPLIDDVGAGALIDFSRFGFEREPLLSDSLKAGSDVVTCSGDKLIGAIQAGIILGRTEVVDAIRKNPFARIVRVDKLTLTILEATLKLFLDESVAIDQVPTLAMLRRPLDLIDATARRIATALQHAGVGADASIIDGSSQMGSGSLPAQDLPTRLVAIAPAKLSVDDLAGKLRAWEPPIITRIQDEKLLIDPRTLLAGDEEILVKALTAILAD
jgi:L-seryl-tRNA(Ser) seleniumtransferase